MKFIPRAGEGSQLAPQSVVAGDVSIRSVSLNNPFANHLVFYRILSDELLVERVIHGARDLPRRLLERRGRSDD